MKVRHLDECTSALVALVAAEDCSRAQLPVATDHLISVAKLKLVNVIGELHNLSPEQVLMAVGAQVAQLRRGDHPCAVLDHALQASTGGALR